MVYYEFISQLGCKDTDLFGNLQIFYQKNAIFYSRVYNYPYFFLNLPTFSL